MTDYRIRVHEEKESAFVKLLKSLQSLGVIQVFERIEAEKSTDEERRHREEAEEVANQYRDLVD